MSQENIYQAPQSAVMNEDSGELLLASRWARLGAAILDTLILMAVIVPVAFAFGVFGAFMSAAETGAEVGMQYNITMAVLGIAGFLVLNGYLLANSGQTIGKKLVGIKIVTVEGGALPPFGKLIGLRYVPLWIVTYLPIVGSILPLVDALFIFRSDKRCIHDLIAGTQVVNC